LVVVLFFLQQFSGMSVITFYAVSALTDAGSSVDVVSKLNYKNGSVPTCPRIPDANPILTYPNLTLAKNL
jgi:hypothetical protein